MRAVKGWLAALLLALSVAVATPAHAQTDDDLRALVAWSAPLTDIQTRAQVAVRSVTALTGQIRNARSPEEVVALLRSAQPTIVAARAELQALRVEAEAIQPISSPTMDESTVSLANLALADTKTVIELFEGAIGDIQQMLPAIERRDSAELQRLAGRLILFAANLMRSQASSMRLAQLQMPITDAGHHIRGARAELMDGLYAMLTISTASDTSAITSAVQRARASIATGRTVLGAERAMFAENPLGATVEPLLDNKEQQLAVLDQFATDLETASARISPRTPMQELVPQMRVIAEHDTRLQALAQEGGALAARMINR